MTTACAQWRPELAMCALGALDAGALDALLAHLERCDACRLELEELAEAATALALYEEEPASSAPSVPPALAARVLDQLHRRASGGRRRAAVLAGVGVALALAVSLVVASWGAAPARAERSIALHGLGRVHAVAVLTPRPWGTAITLTEHGLPAGGTYEVALRAASGHWWSVGTYTSLASPVTTHLSCWLPMRDVRAVEVYDGHDDVVLTSLRSPSAAW